jgi:hypothetical protein
MSATTIETGLATAASDAPPVPPPDIMPRGLALSAALHLGLITAIALGLPNLFKQAPPQETPIAVELVNIAPETHATHPNPYRPQREAKPIPAVAPPAPKPKPEPPRQPAAAAPPSSAASPPPPPPAPPPLKPKPVEAQMPAPRPPPPKPVFEPREKPLPPPQPQPEISKADSRAFAKLLDKLQDQPPDKQQQQQQQQQQRPQVAQFDTLLKNLTQQQAAATDAPPAPRQQTAAASEASSQPKAPLGSELTASEKDLIIEQIERCWDVPAGARDAKDLVVEIKASVNPDGTVREAAVVDSGRYAADPFFRAAADSAKRAVLNPQCTGPGNPLKLPAGEYDAWRNLDLFFNPKDLLGG